jgi:hypothetical protein
MTEIQNTSADRELNALGLLALGSDAYITGQEAAGQAQLVNSASLPTDTAGTDADFLKLGFTFGDPNPSDPMFRPTTLPEGWRKEGSDHAMWSYVVDQLGRRRVAVFYKAAFYDRSAMMRLETLYGYAHTLAYDSALPAYDETWCTRKAFAEQVAALRARLVDDLSAAKRYAAERDDEYWPGRVVELTGELAKHDAWAVKVAVDG